MRSIGRVEAPRWLSDCAAPDEPIVVLQLDGLAERERHRRRA
jgi:hypothetical protein